MNYKKLALLSFGLTVSASVFAGTEKSLNTQLASPGKVTANAQSASIESRCPRPEEFRYFGGHFGDGISIWSAETRHDHHFEWVTDTNYMYQKNPTIKFLEVRVLTESGEGDPANATPYLTCTYKINNWQEIVTMRANHIAYYTSIRNQSAWQYISHQAGKRIGEWRCNKGVDECTFLLSREKKN